MGIQTTGIELSYIVTKAFTVADCQKINRTLKADSAHAGGLDIARLVHSGRDNDSVMLGTNIGKADIHAHIAVQLERDAAFGQLVVAAHHDVFFQLEPRNTISQQPASPVVAVIDRDLHASASQHVSRSQPPGAGTNDANRFGPLGMRLNRLNPTVFPCGIGDVLFHRPNSHCAVAGLLNHAVAFAKSVLGADAPANLWECVGGLTNLIRLFQSPFGGQAQPVGDVVVQRAMGLTIGHAALTAPAGLLFRLFIGVFSIDFLKVLTTQIRHAFLRHIPRNRCKLQHWLLRHDRTLRQINFLKLLYTSLNIIKSHKC